MNLTSGCAQAWRHLSVVASVGAGQRATCAKSELNAQLNASWKAFQNKGWQNMHTITAVMIMYCFHDNICCGASRYSVPELC